MVEINILFSKEVEININIERNISSLSSRLKTKTKAFNQTQVMFVRDVAISVFGQPWWPDVKHDVWKLVQEIYHAEK